MKIQTSRESHRADKRYSGVYQQQGRMITDADWNELMEIVTELRRESLGDVVQSGIPRDGGLGISFVKLNGTSDLMIEPGHLYAGGILARLPGPPVSYDQQADFPDAPDLPDTPYTLYADVWERTLTSLEDRGVRDAALHGADTCARTQTMVQVKWGPDGLKAENPDENPICGNALLTLSLRHASTVSDACDPCAAEELGDDPTRIGNYLFRVEVHDVTYGSAPDDITQLTLKWSSENGAEQYALKDGVPEAYQVDHWAFELFSDTTERLLGVHLAGGTPKRGELSGGYPEPAELAKFDYIRRWDGFAVLKRTGGVWSLEPNRAIDRDLELKTDRSSDEPGYVTFANDVFDVNLRGIRLQLGLAGRVFVAGDYWTAPVREAIDNFEDPILAAAPPTGIVHRYLMLGRVIANTNGGGLKIEDPPTDDVRRRLDFPSLTTLEAQDVGFTDPCQNLFHGAENVQDALHELCGIDASDIAYTDPTCAPPPNGLPTVRSLLAALVTGWPDVDGDTHTTVKDMLDVLLCRLDAARIPYDPTSTSPRWTDITDPGETPHGAPNTVQDALDTLVDNLESSDIRYRIPTCNGGTRFKDLLLGDSEPPTDIKALWDKVLCDLDAGTIPFNNTCPALFQDAATVEDALKNLCTLNASAIAFEVPECTATPSVRSELGLAVGSTPVATVLDSLLCDLNATDIPVEKNAQLRPPLDDPTVQTIQDALNALAARKGKGGLASILESLADAIGIMPDDPRRKALMEAPVSGDQSLAEAIYGLAVDLLRIAAAFVLEYIDLKGSIVTPDGELRIGSSASVNLLGTIRPDARAFAWDQIKARKDLWAGLRANFKNVVWCVLAEFLAGKGVQPAAVQQMGTLYGGTGGYNGPAARLSFLETVYRPLFGKTDLDHTTLVTLRSLVLEFIAALWKRITVDILIHEPPAFSDCPTESQWLQSDPVQVAWKRVRDQDGLMRFHPGAGGPTAPPVAPRLSMERVGRGSTWIARDDSIERYLHPLVVEPLLPSVLRQGRLCPEPSVVLQFDAGFHVWHAAPAVYAGSPALEVLFANLAANALQLTIVDVVKLPAGGPPISAPANLPLLRKPLLLPNDCHMVLGDGRHSPIAHRQRQFATSATGEGMESIDLFLVAEDPLNPRMLYTESGDGVVLAVYHLTAAATDPLPSHAVLVESSGGRQRLILFAGNGTPWWNPGQTAPPPPLRSIAHVALHADVTVAGVAHDQLVLQVVQPGSAGGPKWTFVPFRTFAESLWGRDRFALDGFWNTTHPDGAPLFESLDGSVTPTIPAGIRDIAGTPLFGGVLAGGVVPQPAEVVEPPPGLIAQPPRARPLPLFDGVVRRTGPAGLNGWLTVLAEDEVLGLYQTFQGLLPRQARRYHVNNAAAALATILDNQILIGDVTDQALQFDLGSVAKA